MIIDKILSIAPLWLKKPTVVKMLGALAGYWDYLYDRMMYIRLMTIAATSEKNWLKLIGKGKNLVKLAGETETEFKGRVVNSKQFWREIGSVRGLIKWMEAAGYPATIDEYVWEQDKLADDEKLLGQDTLDGTGDLSLAAEINADRLYRWAEFEVQVDIGAEEFTLQKQKYLVNLIELARRASKKLVLFYFEEQLEFVFNTSVWSLYQLQGDYHIQGLYGEFLDGQGTITDDPLIPYTWNESAFLISMFLEFYSRGTVLEYLDDGGPVFFLDGSGPLGSGGLLDGSDVLDGTGDLNYPSLHPGYRYTLNEELEPLVDEALAPTIKSYFYSEVL